MFSVLNYNLFLVLLTFVGAAVLLFIFFESKITTILDPLSFHLIWVSGNLAFLIGFIVKYGLNEVPVLFLVIFLSYLLLLKFFIKDKNLSRNTDYQLLAMYEVKRKKIMVLFIITAICFFSSKISFYRFAVENPLESWVMYRFSEMQGRVPFFRILELSSSVFFMYFALIIAAFFKRGKWVAVMAIAASLLVSAVSGQRSFFLHFIGAVGVFVFFHYRFIKKNVIRNINRVGIILIFVAMALACLITSFYGEKLTFRDSSEIILNRVIAAADGLEYYLLVDGTKNIKAGFNEYFVSIFGVYLKRITNIQTKNVGQHLSELVVGDNLNFAQGPNYTLPLQVMVLGYYWMPVYVFIMAYVISKMRGAISTKPTRLFLCYYLVANQFVLVTDIEYGVLLLMAGAMFYFFVIYPVLKIRF